MQLFVNARFLTQPLTGVQRYGIEISRQIKKLCPDAVFLCPPDILHAGIARELGAKVAGRQTGHFWEQADLPRYLGKSGAPLFSPGNTAPLIYKNNYVTVHDLAFRLYPQYNTRIFTAYYNWLVPRLCKRATGVFTVSGTVREELVRELGVPRTKIGITYNGLPAGWLEHPPQTGPKEPLVLGIGTYSPRKNHHLLVQAFLESALAKDHQLYLVGDRQEIFRSSGIRSHPRIRVLDRVTDTGLRELYARARLAVSLSAYEGFGLPVLEGLYHGCRILCSDIPVYRELYSNYVYFCKVQNIRGISAALERTIVEDEAIVDPAFLFRQFSYELSASIILEWLRSQT